MLSHLDKSLSGTAYFQGDMLEFDGYAVPVLTLGKFADEAFGIELPAYIREELIATLK